MSTPTCLNCGSSEQERPLVTIKFQSKELYICPPCLPILIHKPYQLVDKLPNFSPSEPILPDDE